MPATRVASKFGTWFSSSSTPTPTAPSLPCPPVTSTPGWASSASRRSSRARRIFTDFTGTISNYETDIFRPIFDEIEKLSGKRYGSTLPDSGSDSQRQRPEATDVAFRVIADHIRTLSFAIADGIQPSNEGRGYVLRRILRRAVRYGRSLGFHEPFFYRLVDVLALTMGDTFPELRVNQKLVRGVVHREEESFNRTIDTGSQQFFNAIIRSFQQLSTAHSLGGRMIVELEPYGFGEKKGAVTNVHDLSRPLPKKKINVEQTTGDEYQELFGFRPKIQAKHAFQLYDTYGFPLDLTQLMARERGLTVDTEGFEKLMEEQRARGRSAQKKETISVEDDNLQIAPTKFLGQDFLETEAVVEAVLPGKSPREINIVLDQTACYAEMGGQVGDQGLLHVPGHDRTEVGQLRVKDTQKRGDVFVHRAELTQGRAPEPGEAVRVSVDADRRNAIQRHHTVTHLLHWALHQLVSKDAAQKGSYVGPDKLTFDFSAPP